ncbi:MAG TPA: TolC family protein [Desulfuromonadaceae bacterium]
MKRALGMAALLAAATGHTAEAATTVKLTLKDAIVMALEKNHLVKAAGFGAGAAREGIDVATSHYYPSLFFEEAFAASNSPTQTFMMKLDEGRFTQNDFAINNLNHPGVWNDFRTALTLQQPLYNPSLAPAREIAVKSAEKEQLGADKAKEDIAFQVFRLYLDVERATAQLKAAEQAVSEAREHLRLARVRSSAGVGLRSDELLARTHLSFAEQQAITVSNNLTLARLQLAITIGLGNGDTVEISEQKPEISASQLPAELAKVALESRSDLRQSRAELDRSDATLKLAKSAYLPMLSGFASYQMNAKNAPFGSDNDGWMAGLSLKWQIFDGFRRGHERGQAAAARAAAAEMLEDKTKEVAFQVQESSLRREEMGKRLEVARHAMQDAEETVRLLSKRFENSLATMVELLDAQTALNQTRANLVETETYYALATGRVYYTAGIFLKEMLK